MHVLVNMNTVIYSKGIAIRKKSQIIKKYLKTSFILGIY